MSSSIQAYHFIKVSTVSTANVNANANVHTTNIQVPIKYLFRFDGGCDTNPGLGGSGCAIYRLYNTKPMKKLKGLGKFHPSTTNNEAEYHGLLLGLEYMKKKQITNFLIEGDSMLVVNHLKKVWKCKAENLLPLYQRSLDLIDEAQNVGIRHIYRDKNEDADALSRQVRPIQQDISVGYTSS